MKNPPWLIRNKWILLVAAILSPIIAVALAMDANGKGQLLPATVFGPLVLVFGWGNGLFWWLVFYYPDQQKPGIDPPVFESRMSRAGSFTRNYFKAFFIGYSVVCVIFTCVVIRLIAA